MRAITAKAARNSRSKTSVSLTLAAVATHATGTPSPSTATFYFVPRLILRAPLGPVRRIGPGEIAPAFGAHRAASQDQVGMASQHANQQGVHLGQHTRLGPACEPPPQGRTAGRVPCRAQAAPGRALAQEAPQSRQHPDGLGRRVARSRLSWRLADLDHGRNQTQDPDVQGCPPCLTCQIEGSASWPLRYIAISGSCENRL